MADIKNILSIAGSDPSGGAGIQADLKTFSALGAYGMAVITGLTAQNTQGVQGVHPVPPDFLRSQLDSVFEDVRVDGVKIGMIGSAVSAQVIADALRDYAPENIVLDPVMVAQSGDKLVDDDTVKAMREIMLPQADVVTPNIPEAEVLLGDHFNGDLKSFARRFESLGVKFLYLKGGHMESDPLARDVYVAGPLVELLQEPRVQTGNTHGTGCTLSSALAVNLARGMAGPSAARAAKAYITGALQHADDLQVGQGAGPVKHFWELWEKNG